MTSPPDPVTVMAGMRKFLTVRPGDDGTLIGDGFDGYEGVLFGGLVLAHAVAAATFEMPAGRRLHSLHGYFLRPVMAGEPIVSRVKPVRDGRSFAIRHVRLEQVGKPAFTMTCSFSADTDGGYEYNLPSRSAVAPPTDFTIEQGPGPWEAAVVGPTSVRADGTRESTHRQWFRIPLDLPDDAHLHAALLAFTTDWTGIGGRPLRLDGDTTGMVSLDHAAWFHRPARADEWLHFDVHSWSTRVAEDCSGARSATSAARSSPRSLRRCCSQLLDRGVERGRAESASPTTRRSRLDRSSSSGSGHSRIRFRRG